MWSGGTGGDADDREGKDTPWLGWAGLRGVEREDDWVACRSKWSHLAASRHSRIRAMFQVSLRQRSRKAMIGPEFTVSDAGRYAVIAKQYMEAAQTLVAAAPHKQRMLFRPTLALAGHGLELMLKACTFLNGQTPATSGQVGHNIAKLWKSEVCEAVRGH